MWLILVLKVVWNLFYIRTQAHVLTCGGYPQISTQNLGVGEGYRGYSEASSNIVFDTMPTFCQQWNSALLQVYDDFRVSALQKYPAHHALSKVPEFVCILQFKHLHEALAMSSFSLLELVFHCGVSWTYLPIVDTVKLSILCCQCGNYFHNPVHAFRCNVL